MADLATLLAHPGIRRADALVREGPGVPTGFPALDRVLPGGGWPAGGVVDLLVPAFGSGELGLLLPLLRRVVAGRRWVVLIDPGHVPYAPGWAGSGVDPAQVAWCRPPDEDEAAHGFEQALRLGGVGLAVLWARPEARRIPWLRFVTAAERGRGVGVVVRAHGDGASVPLRLAVQPDPAGLRVDVLKRRGPPVGRPVLLPSPP